MDAATLPKLMTSDDVSSWLGLHPRAVERLAKRGQVPCRVLPNGDLVFEAAALADWLQALPHAREAVHAS